MKIILQTDPDTKMRALRRCPKCSGLASKVTYSEGCCEQKGFLVGDKPCELRREHLHLSCACTYDWTSGCPDAE